MTAQTRLRLIGALIVGSALYGVLVAKNSELARSVMLGYIGLVLTVFLLVEIWKKPHDR